MFTMIYPFLWFLVYVHARPGSSNCRALIRRSYCIHAIGSEIIGTTFSDWAFQLLYQLGAPHRAQSFTLATSDILASPHRVTELSPPSRGPMTRPSHSIGCRLSEILSDPARPTSVHYRCRELPAPVQYFAIQRQDRDSFGEDFDSPQSIQATRQMLQRLDNQSHTFHQAPTAFFYSFPTLVIESHSSPHLCRKEASTATYLHPFGRSHSFRPSAQ
jgi:hypothetical protein